MRNLAIGVAIVCLICWAWHIPLYLVGIIAVVGWIIIGQHSH